MHFIRRFWIPLFWAAILVIAIVVMHFGFLINFYAALVYGAIGLVAIFINGWIATWEDGQPGGFSNPIKKDKIDSSEPRT